MDAVDYLLKPIHFDRFVRAVNKTFSLARLQEPETLPPAEDIKTADPFVYFRADRKMIKVMLQDILYIESMKDYVKVFTVNGTIITKQSISSVEEMLPEQRFIRTHRSYLVSLQKVRAFTNEVVEIEKTEIPIGKLYRNMVLKSLGE